MSSTNYGIVRKGKPAERDHNLVLVEDFVSSGEVTKNGGTINGNVDFNNGYAKINDNSYISYGELPLKIGSNQDFTIRTVITTPPFDNAGSDGYTEWNSFFTKSNGSSTGISVMIHPTSLEISVFMWAGDGSVETLKSSAIEENTKYEVVLVRNASGTNYLYLNGIEEDSVADGNKDYTSNEPLNLGVYASSRYSINSKIHFTQFFESALDPKDVTEYYNGTMFNYEKYAILSCPMGLAQHDPETVIDTQLLNDGDMENAGTSNYTCDFGTLTKESSDLPNSSQCMRISPTGETSGVAMEQSVFTPGKKYKVTGYARSDGDTNAPAIACGGVYKWVGTTSTDWQHFDLIFTADDNNISILSRYAIDGYVEFDNITVNEVYARTLDVSGNNNHLNFWSDSEEDDPVKLSTRGYYFASDGTKGLKSSNQFMVDNNTEMTGISFIQTPASWSTNHSIINARNSTLPSFYAYYNNATQLWIDGSPEEIVNTVKDKMGLLSMWSFTYDGNDNFEMYYNAKKKADIVRNITISNGYIFQNCKETSTPNTITQGNLYGVYWYNKKLSPIQMTDKYLKLIKSVNTK